MRYESKRRRKNRPWKIKPIEVSIITINYNGFNDTCQMVESLRTHIRSAVYEIIVVDNASYDDEAAKLQKKYPYLRTVRSTFNRGFSGGNNLGATIAKGKYLFFLNNDTFVRDDKLRQLIDRLEADETNGGVSPTILHADEEETIQYAGFTPLSPYTLRNRSIGEGLYLDELQLSATETPYMHGAAMLVKKDVYIKSGRMPELYFLYYEELDWSHSIRERGYKLWHDPCWTIYHKESQSTGNESPLKVFYMTRNRFLFAYRNRTLIERWICHLYLIFVVMPRDCLRYMLRFKFSLIPCTWKGIIAYFILTKKQKLETYGFKYSYRLS